KPMAISAATQNQVDTLKNKMRELIENLPDEIPTVTEEMPVYELPEEEFPFVITREDNGSFHVTGKRIERAAAMTYWDYDEAVLRFQNSLETLGVTAALEEAGVSVGDTVFIGDFELEWTE